MRLTVFCLFATFKGPCIPQARDLSCRQTQRLKESMRRAAEDLAVPVYSDLYRHPVVSQR
jgi:hypothetical protein